MNRRAAVIFASFALVLVSRPSSAQGQAGALRWEDSARRSVQSAVIAGRVDELVQERAVIERAIAAYPRSAWLYHFLGYALYRETILRQAVRGADKSELAKLLNASRQALEASAQLDPSIPETYAVLAQVVGLQIGLNPDNVMVLGEAAEEALKRAASFGPNNPRVALIRGINALYTPPEYGGGPAEARRHLNRAIQLFATDTPRTPAPAWGLAEAYAWIGVIHVRERNFDAARAAYDKALEIEPNYAWIKGRLLPGMDRMIKAESKKREPSSSRQPD